MVRCALFVLAAVCLALVSCDDQTEKHKQLLNKCLQDSSTTVENLRAFTNGETYPDGVKCFFKCVMQGNKALKDDGTIDVEAIVKYAGEDKRANVVKCSQEATSTDLCEKAHQYEKCFLAAEPAFFKATVVSVIGTA